MLWDTVGITDPGKHSVEKSVEIESNKDRKWLFQKAGLRKCSKKSMVELEVV